jgi:hypothetical protein
MSITGECSTIDRIIESDLIIIILECVGIKLSSLCFSRINKLCWKRYCDVYSCPKSKLIQNKPIIIRKEGLLLVQSIEALRSSIVKMKFVVLLHTKMLFE